MKNDLKIAIFWIKHFTSTGRWGTLSHKSVHIYSCCDVRYEPHLLNAARRMDGGHRPQLLHLLASMPVNKTAIISKPAPAIQAIGNE
jgi:hypothetical protein